MRCPALRDLPPSPSGKTGWPWTEECAPLPDTMTESPPWVKISIITPNYNYAQFIEETIRSVLLQGYPNLDYIIIDDGSTDNSMEIIKKYKKWLTFFTSQPNRGQPNAVNEGMKLASGKILGYLNSDDFFNKSALRVISDKFFRYNIDWLSGRCLGVDAQSRFFEGVDKPVIRKGFLGWVIGRSHLPQPSTFWSDKLAKDVGEFDERLNYMLDYDFFVRSYLKGYRPFFISDILSKARYHKDCKSIKYQNSYFVFHDFSIERNKFRPLLTPGELRIVSENKEFLGIVKQIQSKERPSLLSDLGSLIGLALKYHWLLLDSRLYSCLKYTLIKNAKLMT